MRNKSLYQLAKSIYLKLENKAFQILRKIGIGKRLLILAILIIVVSISLISYLSINSFIEQAIREEESKLVQGINMINKIIEERKDEYNNYAELLSRMDSIKTIAANPGREDKYILNEFVRDLGSMSYKIQLVDNDFDLMTSSINQSSVQLNYKEKLKKDLIFLTGDGITVSFLANNNYLDIGAISPIYKEKKHIANIIVGERISVQFINRLVNNMDYDIQLYQGQDLIYSSLSTFARTDLLKEFIAKSDDKKNKQNNIIKDIKVNGGNYFIGYMPLEGFYGHPVGYLTFISSKDRVIENINRMIRKRNGL